MEFRGPVVERAPYLLMSMKVKVDSREKPASNTFFYSDYRGGELRSLFVFNECTPKEMVQCISLSSHQAMSALEEHWQRSLWHLIEFLGSIVLGNSLPCTLPWF